MKRILFLLRQFLFFVAVRTRFAKQRGYVILLFHVQPLWAINIADFASGNDFLKDHFAEPKTRKLQISCTIQVTYIIIYILYLITCQLVFQTTTTEWNGWCASVGIHCRILDLYKCPFRWFHHSVYDTLCNSGCAAVGDLQPMWLNS